jgi:hypothetical protein
MNITRFNSFWYAFNDQSDKGNSIITNLEPLIKIPAGYFVKFVKNEGNPFGSGGQCARIDYQIGTASSVATNWVGVGTSLTPTGDSAKNLAGATAISFWAKAAEISIVEVQVGLSTVTDCNYYYIVDTITTSWKMHNVLFSRLHQMSWGQQIPFETSKITKIQIEVFKNGTNTSHAETYSRTGTLWIDDVQIHNYTWKP